MWKRQHKMTGCRQCSKNNLRSDRLIQVKMGKEQTVWDGTKVFEEPYLENKIRATVKGKKEESEEIFRMSARMVQTEVTRVGIRKKNKTWSHAFIQNHAVCGLFPGHRFWVDLQVFRTSRPRFEPRLSAVESPTLGMAARSPPRVNNFISLCFFYSDFTH